MTGPSKRKRAQVEAPEATAAPTPSWIERQDGKYYIDLLAMEFNTNAPHWLSKAARKKAEPPEG